MKLAAFFLLAVLILFTACQRDTDQFVLSNTQIAKKIVLNPDQPGSSDTLTITEYRYDGQDRIVEIADSIRTPIANQNVQITRFYYHGSEEWPYERTVYSDSPDGTRYRDTTFFWYENGVVNADSTINDIDYPPPYVYKSTHVVTAKTIVNSGNRTITNITHYDLSYAPYVTVCDSKMIADKLYLNGNIISEDLAVTDNGNPCGGSSPYTRNVQVIYDDKPSCFKGITPVYPSLSSGFSNYSQQNNMVEYISPGGHTKCTYTYRADGYPVSYLSQRVGSSVISKTLIFYRE